MNPLYFPARGVICVPAGVSGSGMNSYSSPGRSENARRSCSSPGK